MKFYLKLCVTFFGLVYGGLWLMSATVNAAENPAQEIFNEVNELREEAGLNTLEWNEDLQECSDVRADEITNVWSHKRPNGQPWYTVNRAVQGGENLAYDQEGNEGAIVGAWLDSPAHRDNIFYPDFATMAITTVTTGGETYVACEFGY